MEILTAPPHQIGTHNVSFSAQFPTTKGPENLTPNYGDGGGSRTVKERAARRPYIAESPATRPLKFGDLQHPLLRLEKQVRGAAGFDTEFPDRVCFGRTEKTPIPKIRR